MEEARLIFAKLETDNGVPVPVKVKVVPEAFKLPAFKLTKLLVELFINVQPPPLPLKVKL